MPTWDEDKHPRSSDGKFGSGGSRSAAAARIAAAGARRASQPRLAPHHEAHIAKVRDDAFKQARDGMEILGVKIPPKSEADARKFADEVANDKRETIHRGIKDDEVLAANPHLKEKLDESLAIWVKDDSEARRSALRSIVDEHENEQDARAAEAAGHVLPVTELQPIAAVNEALEAHVAAAAAAQAETARAALASLRDVNTALGDDGIDEPEDARHAISMLAERAGISVDLDDDEHANKIDDHDDDHEHPGDKLSRDEFHADEDYAASFDGGYEEYEKEHHQLVAEHEAHAQRRSEDTKSKALDAQRAFERLHQQQVDELAETRTLVKKADAMRDKVIRKFEGEDEDSEPSLLNQQAFAAHDRLDHGDEGPDEGEPTFADEHVDRDYQRARRAAAWRARDIVAKLQEQSVLDIDEHAATARDGIKSTAKVIRDLSKVSGVKPTLARSTGRTKLVDDDES